MRYQPQGLQRIDRRNPLSRGLLQAFAGFGRVDAANGKSYSSIGAPKQVAGGWEITTANASLYRPALAQEKTNAFTVAVLVRSLGNSSPYASITGITYDNAGSAPYGDQIDRGSTGSSLRFAFNGNGEARSTGEVGNLAVGVDEWLFATFTDGYQALYRQNGGLVWASNYVGLPAYTATSQINIGPSTNDGRNPNVVVKASLRWGRVLAQAEINAVMANPWQLFEAPDEDDFVSVSAGPTYTLGASGGAYALTGAAATMSARRRLAAAAAGFALTPLAAALKASRKLAAASGSLAVTGSSARLAASRRLPAEPAAWALSASAAKIAAARKLTAAPAAFALTGGAVTFVYTSAPGGQGPTYTLTGGSGAFLLTASTARLLLARRLVAAAGAFSAAGSPAALVATRRLSAAAGSLAIVAAPAGLRATRRLPAAAASFSLTGSTATFFYSPIDRPGEPTYTLTAVGGAMGLTGTGIGMRARRRLSGGAGQLTLTGSTAQLVYSQQIVYARAPAGSGYTPKTIAAQHRPASAPSARPAALQRNTR